VKGRILPSTFELYIIIKGAGKYDNRFLQGTYVHLDLVTNLCSWISDEFGYKVNRIVQFINGFDKLKELKNIETSECEKINKTTKEISEKHLNANKELIKIKKELNKTKTDLENNKKELSKIKKQSNQKTNLLLKLIKQLKN
jgi:septal ring factor EnvC (AmiA/AmiB activator)